MGLLNFLKTYQIHISVGLLLLLALIGFLVYMFVWKNKQTNQNNMTTKNADCLLPSVQKKIMEDINAKLKEIDACDCKENCSIVPGVEEDDYSKFEHFGNDNFY